MQAFRKHFRRILSVALVLLLFVGIGAPVGLFGTEVEASSDSIVTSKSYDPATGRLSIEAYVTGEQVTYVTEEAKPLDVVLVLDATESLDGRIKYATSLSKLNSLPKNDSYQYLAKPVLETAYEVRWDTSTSAWQYCKNNSWISFSDSDITSSKCIFKYEYEELQHAARAFVDNVASVSPKTRIGVVKFGYGYQDHNSTDGTTILNGLTECSSTGCTTIKSSINSINKSNLFFSTNIKKGIEVGATVFDSYSTRDKVMILFTDGEPNQPGINATQVCVDAAYNVKQSGVTVYTVGMFDSGVDLDAFMNQMSSKYPNAKTKTSDPSVVVPGTSVEGTYYYKVSDSQSLDSIFQAISSTITTGGAKITTLNSQTVLRDIISSSFVYDGEGDNLTHIYKSNYIGENQWSTPIEVTDGSITVNFNATTQTFDISGFDYSANWCGKEINSGVTTYRGTKIIVSIPIKPVDGATGATGVPTNDPGSGIVPPGEDEPAQNLPIPTTDIPTDIKVTKKCVGYIPDDATFDFEASVSAAITGYLQPDANNYSKATTQAKTYEAFTLGKDQSSSVMQNILVATADRPSTVTITEKNVPKGYSVTISDGTNSETFTGTGADVSKTFTVTAGMEITVTNSKTTLDMVQLTVKNKIGGNMGDKSLKCDYDVSYYNQASGKQDSPTLGDDESKVYTDVDLGSTVVITQDELSGYDTKVYVNDELVTPKNGKYLIIMNADTVVEFRNTLDYSVETGVILEYLPYALILALVAVGVAIVIIRNRKVSVDDNG